MGQNSSPHKPNRTEVLAVTGMAQNVVASSPERDDKLWFDDGTVVLVVQDTEFRVYRGLLEDQFPIFKNLLSLPQPVTHDRDNHRDYPCPVVTHASSCKNLCARRSRPFRRAFASGTSTTWPDVEKEALDYLKMLFPSALSRPTISWPPKGFHPSSAIVVVNIARLTGKHSLLPIALYRCCQLDANITQGFIYSDGYRETLSWEDLGRCFVARSRLTQETYRLYTRSFLAASDTSRRRKEPCRSNNTCWEAVAAKKFFTVANGTADSLEHPLPFVHLEDHLPDDVRDTTFCDTCWKMFRECEEEEHRVLWQRLPSFFGLDLLNWG
ncbi:hypothetical protein OH76DRAFT_1483508 [Lentinus brumalis]|uniref:BTB domain-containing protein n=1 Tax=Lentinus brumalis TaxID=2498619 RepID=A0A371D910_9APHY|nr:hypothetical protein OH76DRAFT_1483508 [Polyporus brumalis]